MTDGTTDENGTDREFLAYGIIETIVYLWGVKIYVQREERLRALGGVVLAAFNIFMLSRRLHRD